MIRQFSPHPVSARLLGAALLPAVLLMGASAAPAQEDETAIIEETSDYVTRDERVAFDRRSADFARFDLVDLEPGDHGRSAALVALGASGSVQGRALLVDEATTAGDRDERIAALYGLGELGPRVGESIDVLLQASRNANERVAGAALVALVRTTLPAGRERVDELRRGSDDLAAVARQVLAHDIDPRRSVPPVPYVDLYELRWHAGRTYGVVDGKVWSATLMQELADDMAFLDGLVMRLTVELNPKGAKDHMLEILLDGVGAQRVIAATQLMPQEVEALVESGVWKPADDKEWKWLSLTILHDELSLYFPTTLARSVHEPVCRWIAAGLLFRDDSKYADIVRAGFREKDPRNRAYTAYACAASELTDFRDRLREMVDDKDTWAAANALGSLIRMGSKEAVEIAEDMLALPPDERPRFMTSFLFEVLERAAPDTHVMAFVEDIARRLNGPDRAAADAILLLHGTRVDSTVLRRELPLMNPIFPEAVRGARALGELPNSKDVELLARLFPREKAPNMNLELATALARQGHSAPEPLLEAAVWKLGWNQSVLAAGLVEQIYGRNTLITWVVNPPDSATEEDVRRVGYAIGEWGGLKAVEQLRRELGTTAGAELPALQGAVLGALGSRTR